MWLSRMSGGSVAGPVARSRPKTDPRPGVVTSTTSVSMPAPSSTAAQ
jgi:hypothetical protein